MTKKQKAISFVNSKEFNNNTLNALRRMTETSNVKTRTLQDRVADYLIARFKITVDDAREISKTVILYKIESL